MTIKYCQLRYRVVEIYQVLEEWDVSNFRVGRFYWIKDHNTSEDTVPVNIIKDHNTSEDTVPVNIIKDHNTSEDTVPVNIIKT